MDASASTGESDDLAIRGTHPPVQPLPDGAEGHCLRMSPRSIRARARVLSLALAAAVWARLDENGPATAATAVRVSDDYPGEICGIPVDVHYELKGAVLSKGGTLLMAPGQESWVCTDPATGKRITFSDANPTRYRSTDNGDGTYTLTAEHDGIHTVLTAHGRRRLFVDAGRSVETIVVDPAQEEPVSYERLTVGSRWDGMTGDLCAAAISGLT